MARSRGSGGRSSGRSSAFGSSGQSRSASTAAMPSMSRQQPAPAQQSNAYSQPPATTAAQPRQPGMFAQMASTAAGVAVGSAVGHTIGAGITGMFSGSGSNESVQQQQQQQQNVAPMSDQGFAQEQVKTCDVDAKNFTRCLDENNGNFQICDYYLQQLKACQEAARQY
ncbi:hypothetical protein Kpol_1037p17 [Vanderwaltozyma polyspora DSM 70294]|uniref:CHCH domain-containing protein n=1 Tax=Vanderwaltozyma polyspora (strain ATCC 22028 / DSM 70294 / BCRC 21397 / CBS 2163 / NBRC 10782 / NRRL Y-8283 / UCD 57-17) TaxID=436907 RepID=A7TJV9_VANPO|nr:uncharacterized protein Kpol_1037p17 [Vanderwaltozyma polyspora DSM 70294]EDO17421.1 hypothetical protein Kpol_1037p17 [Vanderwaltozyma polyspora DSM 70294]